jgi:hypothetical protein
LPVLANRKVLLGLRTHEPRTGEWWLFGGKWPWGTPPRAALTALACRELGLRAVGPDRFVELPYRSLCWEVRREPPQSDGAHDVSHPFALVLNAAEQAIALRHLAAGSNPEHSDAREWTLEQLIELYGSADPIVGITRDAIEATAGGSQLP